MELQIRLSMNNAAFADNGLGPLGEVKRILLEALRSNGIDYLFEHGGEISLRDLNGNCCGRLVVSGDAEPATGEDRIKAALNTAIDYGGIDGTHHKKWVIDQMVRALTGDKYPDFVAAYNDGDEGPNTYAWETGIAP